MNSDHQNFQLLEEITDLLTINRKNIVNTDRENSDYLITRPQILNLEAIICMISRIIKKTQWVKLKLIKISIYIINLVNYIPRNQDNRHVLFFDEYIYIFVCLNQNINYFILKMGSTCIIHKDLKSELVFTTSLEGKMNLRYPEVDK